MRTFIVLAFSFFGCHATTADVNESLYDLRPLTFPVHSWPYFLQHLPAQNGPILDFRGNLVSNQGKHAAIINYDVGKSDLQQCADALMRIRAEYLFSQLMFDEIGFHFTSGGYYSWTDYCKGIRPVSSGNGLRFLRIAGQSGKSHQSLRKYLDIVYAYANTISLCKELKPAEKLQVGSVIIFPGSPGHCCMIMDEAINGNKDTVYKLVEGYMPAQSIYILSNPYEPSLSPWYHLSKSSIATASCIFKNYYLRKFE